MKLTDVLILLLFSLALMGSDCSTTVVVNNSIDPEHQDPEHEPDGGLVVVGNAAFQHPAQVATSRALIQSALSLSARSYEERALAGAPANAGTPKNQRDPLQLTYETWEVQGAPSISSAIPEPASPLTFCLGLALANRRLRRLAGGPHLPANRPTSTA